MTEHSEFFESHAVERYLLGEMTAEERATFEEHYFDCRICAAGLTDGTRLMYTGRQLAKGRTVPKAARPPLPFPAPHSRSFRWLPQAAAASLIFAVLGGAAGYRIAQMMHAAPAESRVLTFQELQMSAWRAPSPNDLPAVAASALRFDVPPDPAAVKYLASVRCGGKVRQQDEISREVAAETVSLAIGELPAGRCELVIEGVRKDGNRFPIARSAFEVVGER